MRFADWTSDMVEYLAWVSLRKTHGGTSKVYMHCADRIKAATATAAGRLTDEERATVEHVALTMANEYHKRMFREFEEKYEDRLFVDDEEDWWEWERPTIEYNEAFLELWRSSVRSRRTLRMRYDSETSGPSERLVDPYETRAPHVKGYCHLRKEVRRFRLDRIIDLQLTEETFVKR